MVGGVIEGFNIMLQSYKKRQTTTDILDLTILIFSLAGGDAPPLFPFCPKQTDHFGSLIKVILPSEGLRSVGHK